MKAVIYVRVANAERADLRVERFLIFCRRYAADAGFTIIGEFHDIGAGTMSNRPGLAALRRKVTDESIGGVIVYTLSQLSRSSWQHQRLQKEFAERGVRLHSVSRSIKI